MFSRAEIASTVEDVLMDNLEILAFDYREDADLIGEYEMDEAEFLSIVSELEENFEISFPFDSISDFAELSTPSRLIEWIFIHQN